MRTKRGNKKRERTNKYRVRWLREREREREKRREEKRREEKNLLIHLGHKVRSLDSVPSARASEPSFSAKTHAFCWIRRYSPIVVVGKVPARIVQKIDS
jgi:hypothetical protein